MSRTLITAVAVFAAAAVLCAPAAMADAARETATHKIAYSDLDLSQGKSVKIMYKRLRSATAKVCGGAPRRAELAEKLSFRACQQDAMARAVADVGSPALAQLHDRNGGKAVVLASR